MINESQGYNASVSSSSNRYSYLSYIIGNHDLKIILNRVLQSRIRVSAYLLLEVESFILSETKEAIRWAKRFSILMGLARANHNHSNDELLHCMVEHSSLKQGFPGMKK